MKIFSAHQLYRADEITEQKQGISSIDLMERAAEQVFVWLDTRLKQAQVPIHIFCGIGNNGGDGLALGRLLLNNGYNTTIYIANFTDKRSPCFLTNYNRIKEVTKKWPVLMTSEIDFPEIQADDIIIDSLFGIGLNRPIKGWVKKLILHLNAQRAFRLAIDIPSGLSANEPLLDPEAVLKANHTLTFQAPKLSFFLPETGRFVPYFEVLDIGLDAEFLQAEKPLAQLIFKRQAQQFYMQREKFSHKGTYGHTLIIGGSRGKMGAVCLSAKSALRTGAGLVTAYVPSGGNDIVQVSVPEVMTLNDLTEDHIASIQLNLKPTAIAVGMGMGQHTDTSKALEELLSAQRESFFVLDADALNLLSSHSNLFNVLPPQSILTPHEGELKRLIGEWENDFDKIKKTKDFAKKFQVIIVVKGAHTLVVDGDALFINTTGNPGMATAGSGDVLSGVIAGLLSQGYDPLVSSVFGVFLHGSAGNIAANKRGYEALIASDMIEHLGDAFMDLFRKEEEEITREQS
jgi:ADP-dependent NAD(P)H-hydrate dehydratase / NAD(P)H-hydrate epimerase